jgi:cytochrome b
MKKALSLISLIAGSVMIASAQVSIGVNGGSVSIGTQATQGQVNGGPLLQLLALAQTIVSRLGIFAVGLAVVVFFWFLIKFIVKGGDSADEKNAGIKGMGYSILAIFVMVSIWGIIGAMGGMLGIGQGGSVPIPGIPVPTN